MRVLVLGSGGREHALAWKIKQSSNCQKIFLHPGNAGTRREGYEVLPASDLPSLIAQAQSHGIHLVVIGPEVLLAEGYADEFRRAGFPVVGPNKYASQLETSKVFSKEFMSRADVPTAKFEIIESEAALRVWPRLPMVLKLDGLAAGKGVVIAQTQEDLENFADRIWKAKEFGPGPHRVVAEEVLKGREISLIGLCDGETFLPLSSATDYKRVHDGNAGPNTGGMGAVSPSPFLTDSLLARIQSEIVGPILRQFQKEKMEYRGVLYIGLMIDDSGAPHILEFNARFGDPETQAILLRLNSDFITLLDHTSRGTLKELPPLQWDPEVSIYVVACAEGYPGTPKNGDAIDLGKASEKATIFFSGVAEKDGVLITNGGRVLGVGVKSSSVSEARDEAYRALGQIHFPGMHFRKDIGL